VIRPLNPRVSEESFDDFLVEQGLYDHCNQHAIKELTALQLADAIKNGGSQQGEDGGAHEDDPSTS
jgi:hypothetical protein